MDNYVPPVVLVTGASRGIGLATVKSLLEEQNAYVVAISRSTNDALMRLQSQHPSSLVQVHGDITDPTTSQHAVASAISTWSRLTGIILNAAILGPIGPIVSTPVTGPDSWRSLMDVNFFSLLYTVQAALPALRESRGKVIFVSSGASVKGIHAWGPYAASKAAMNSLCRTLAAEEKDVVSVAVRPGAVNTDMHAEVRNARNALDEDHEYFVKLHKEGKLVDPAMTGYLLGKLSISADPLLSGQYVDWEGKECSPYRKP